MLLVLVRVLVSLGLRELLLSLTQPVTPPLDFGSYGAWVGEIPATRRTASLQSFRDDLGGLNDLIPINYYKPYHTNYDSYQNNCYHPPTATPLR